MSPGRRTKAGRIAVGITVFARQLIIVIACLAWLAADRVPAAAAVFSPLGGSLSVRAGDNPQKFESPILGQTIGLSDTSLGVSLSHGSASLNVTRIGGNTAFSSIASSVTNPPLPLDQSKSFAGLSFIQSFSSATPVWLDVSALVISPPADSDVNAVLTLKRTGQVAPILDLGDTNNVAVAQAGFLAAGSFTLHGVISTSASTPNAHAGQINGSLLVASLADFNGSTIVDGADLATLKSNFGSTVGTFATGNLDDDGDCDGFDFLLWQRQLGVHTTATPTTAAVPEPGSVALLATLAVAGAYSRTRRSAARRASMSPAR